LSAEDLQVYRSNISIGKLSGSGNVNGSPDSYMAGRREKTIPSEIVWNSQYSRWEICFDVSGFSDFFLENPGSSFPMGIINGSG